MGFIINPIRPLPTPKMAPLLPLFLPPFIGSVINPEIAPSI